MQAFAKLLGQSQSETMADGFAAASASASTNASAVPLPAASDCTYSPAAAAGTATPPQPKVEPIAHLPTVLPASPPGMASGPRPPPGHLLDVTPSYIVYSVKNGLVRVLDRGDGSKTLLRGHNVKVGDVAFFAAGGEQALQQQQAAGAGGGGAPASAGAGADVLATVGGRGDKCSVLVWRLLGGSNNGDAGSPDGQLSGEKLLEVRFRPVPRRILWHPFDPNKFVLLHDNAGAGAGSRTVATLVETTRLATVQHTDASAHAVCLCGGASDPNVQSVSDDGVGGDDIEGALQLIVSGNIANSSAGVGANDLVFSPSSARHILTAHEDGCVRLWDTGSRVYVDATSGLVMGAGSDRDISAACLATVQVSDGTDTNGGVMSCRFLPGFFDARPPTAAAGAAAADVTSYLTPPFLTGSEGNTRITLWSPFTSTGSPPVPVRTFQIGLDQPIRERNVPMVLGVGTTPTGQTHAFVADSEAGKIYVLHLSSVGGSYGKVATGFDYVVPFDTVHPIYSMKCTAASSSSGDGDVDTDNDDAASGLSLYCVQSKAIQVLTFTGKMLAGPAAGASNAGVTVLQATSAAAVTDEEEEGEATAEANAEALVAEFEDYEEDGGEEDGGADETFEDYDDDEDDDDNDNDSEEDEGEAAAPATTPAASGADPFSNWLGALAAGTTGGAPAPEPSKAPAARSASSPLPPGPTPPPPAMAAAQSEGDFASIPPPPGATAVPPTPAPTPMVVPKPAPPPGLVQQALLNPMDLLSPSAASKEDDTQEKALAQKQAEKKTETKKQQRPKQEEKKRPKSNPKQKKGKAADAAADAPGKIAILKRDETPVIANTSAPAANVASSSAPITTHAALVEDVRVAIRTELLSAGLAGPGAKKEQPSADALASAVSKSVTRALEKSLADPVKKSVEKIVAADKKKDGAADAVKAEALAAAVVEGVQQPVVEAFHQTMRNVIIPAYEAGTRQMIAQTSTVLSQGMANVAAEQTRALQELRPSGPDEATLRTMQSMAAQMENLAIQVDSLKAEVARLSSAMPRQGGGPPGMAPPMMQAPAPPPPPQVDPAQLLREEIVALLRQRSYDEAFTKALAAPAGNGEFALFACKNSNLQDVLEGESGPMLSQHILLCLAQQLGAILPNASGPDLRCCLTWLQDVAVTLDPNNPNIARHVGGVLTQLVEVINAKTAEGDPSLQRPLRMLLQVIRGIGN